jgi:hypothetical protein
MTRKKFDIRMYDNYSPAITEAEWIIVRDEILRAKHSATRRGIEHYSIRMEKTIDSLRAIQQRPSKDYSHMLRADYRETFMQWGMIKFGGEKLLEPIHITIGLTKDQWNRLKAFKAFLNEVLPP